MIRYRRISPLVLISMLTILVLFTVSNVWAQHTNLYKTTGQIKGRVTDSETGLPLPGVNVMLKSSYMGAATDHDGYYTIQSVHPGTYTISASMMGYGPKDHTVTVIPQNTITQNIVMEMTILQSNEIVITATGVPQFYKNAPVKTSVIPRKMIQAQKANNLAEVLDFQTGVRMETNCQNCNFTQVRLLGLEGHYTQILIDSDPVVSGLASVYGLEQFPDEMIERVEIVKGGGSSLYGSSAMAGVVNLITSRPTHNDVSVDYRNNSIDGKMDHKAGITLSRTNKSGNSSGFLFASVRDRSPWDANDDGFSEISKIENQSVGLNWYHKPQTNGELAIQLHTIHENRRGGNKFDLAPHQADIAEAIETWRYGGSLKWSHTPAALWNYKAYTSFAYTDRDTYYGAHQDPNAYGKSKNPLFVSGLQSNYRLNSHVLTIGLQYNQENLQDEASSYNRSIDDTFSNFGVILQDSWTIDKGEKTELVFGTRMDKHSKINSAIMSPRIALRWHISNAFTFRGGASTGFKPPQIFDEDLHIGQVGGARQITTIDPDLKEERATTFYGGLEYTEIIGINGLRLSLSGFHTKLENTFVLDEQDDPSTPDIEFFRINGDGSLVQGIEIEVGFRSRKVEITTGMTLQNSHLDSPEPDFNSTHIFRTPDVYGSMKLSYNFNRAINLLAIAKYTGPMYAPHYAGYIANDCLEKTNDFITFDLIANYRTPLSGHLNGTISAGIYNITNQFQSDFDKGVDRDAGYVYGPSVPRRFLIGFTLGH